MLRLASEFRARHQGEQFAFHDHFTWQLAEATTRCKIITQVI